MEDSSKFLLSSVPSVFSHYGPLIVRHSSKNTYIQTKPFISIWYNVIAYHLTCLKAQNIYSFLSLHFKDFQTIQKNKTNNIYLTVPISYNHRYTYMISKIEMHIIDIRFCLKLRKQINVSVCKQDIWLRSHLFCVF